MAMSSAWIPCERRWVTHLGIAADPGMSTGSRPAAGDMPGGSTRDSPVQVCTGPGLYVLMGQINLRRSA